MRLTSPSDVRSLLARLDFRPNRVLGQNFLIDANILRIMLDAADVQPDETVLEIGPGLGVLTGPLLGRARRVIAIEKDDRLHAYLQQSLAGTENLTLLHADALEADLTTILNEEATKVVANLPYAVGSRILVELFHAAVRPRLIVVTVQREVADRLVAGPGVKDYSLLSIFAQLDYAVDVVKRVSRTCFFPPPQVESAIVKLARRAARDVPLADEARFREIVKACFAQRRKQLGTILGQRDALNRAGIDPARRPETLSVAEWCRLANAG